MALRSDPASFALEVDHVVVFTTVDAPEAKALEPFLRGAGGVTRHGDLGTASTSFFFDVTYLELFWVHDLSQAVRALEPVGLDVERRMGWRQAGYSPFGLMLRRRAGQSIAIPFATKSMPAIWMPGEVMVDFAADVKYEPYYGVVPDALAFPAFRANIPDVPHPLGVKVLTAVHIAITGARSPIAQMIIDAGLATIEPGPEPLMTLTFDGGAQGKVVDVRPALPLVLRC